MNDIVLIEESYKRYISNSLTWTAENVIQVDMSLLQQLNLAETCYLHVSDYELKFSFHFLETDEKITLWNDKFVIWIVPDSLEGELTTSVMIALNRPANTKLELIYTATGVFNSSQLILRILEKFLQEIEENEQVIDDYRIGPLPLSGS